MLGRRNGSSLDWDRNVLELMLFFLVDLTFSSACVNGEIGRGGRDGGVVISLLDSERGVDCHNSTMGRPSSDASC